MMGISITELPTMKKSKFLRLQHQLVTRQVRVREGVAE